MFGYVRGLITLGVRLGYFYHKFTTSQKDGTILSTTKSMPGAMNAVPVVVSVVPEVMNAMPVVVSAVPGAVMRCRNLAKHNLTSSKTYIIIITTNNQKQTYR